MEELCQRASNSKYIYDLRNMFYDIVLYFSVLAYFVKQLLTVVAMLLILSVTKMVILSAFITRGLSIVSGQDFLSKLPSVIHVIEREKCSSHDGAGQQCCYDLDGYLMMTSDNKWGGTPMRSHNLGVLPWNEATKIPTLSHWLQDISPFYPCCLWQDEQSGGCQTYRFERRPSQDCVGYLPPGGGEGSLITTIITDANNHFSNCFW